MSRTGNLDKQLGTGLGESVPVKSYKTVDVDLGKPIPTGRASDIDDWLFGGKSDGAKRKKVTKRKSSVKRTVVRKRRVVSKRKTVRRTTRGTRSRK